jgi:uncharacterized protein (TIGR02246 family)
MKSRTSSVLVVVLALSAACAPKAAPPPPAPDAAAIKTAIEAEMAKFGPSFQKKDAKAVAELFAEDATWILPDATTFTGRASIEAGAKAFFESFESATPGPMTIDRLIVISDNEAVTFAHGTFNITMKGKKPEMVINPFADHWRKGTDGKWLVAYEVNAEGPVPDANVKKD